MSEEVGKAAWWQVQSPKKITRRSQDQGGVADFNKTVGGKSIIINKRRKWNTTTIIDPVPMLTDFARIDDWFDLPPTKFKSLSRGGKRPQKLNISF